MHFQNFVEEYPLYRKYKRKDIYINPLEFNGLTFFHECVCSEKDTTFELKITDILKIEQYTPKSHYINKGTINVDTGEITTNARKDTVFLNDVINLEGICKKCHLSKIHIILKFLTSEQKDCFEYSVQKIGQFPPIQKISNMETYKFLSEEDRTNYLKAVQCLNFGYGIGAFAYFRRILENEIFRIIQKLIDLELANSEKIKESLSRYNSNHQMSKLIKKTNEYIPETLKFNGENPLEIFYKQLSVGIHKLEDEVCLDKAANIDIVLNFTIIHLNNQIMNATKVKNAFDDLLT